ncbi:hypothetical protein ACFX14_036678 [Malus domestica]
MIFLWIGPVGGYGFLEAQKSKASDFMEQMGLREADYTAVAAHDLVGPDLVPPCIYSYQSQHVQFHPAERVLERPEFGFKQLCTFLVFGILMFGGYFVFRLKHLKAWEVAQVPFKNLAMMVHDVDGWEYGAFV